MPCGRTGKRGASGLDHDLIVIVAVLAVLLLAVAFGVFVRLVRTRRSMRRAGLPTGPKWVSGVPSCTSYCRPT